MPQVTAQFVLGYGLISSLISYRGGRYSHVDLVLPDGRLLGARSDKIGFIPPGVQIRPPVYDHWKICDRFSLDCTKQQADTFYDFGIDQIGKPYDKIGILGFIADRDWREEDAWFCSELLTAALELALSVNLPLGVNKIDPTAAALIFSTLGAKPVN